MEPSTSPLEPVESTTIYDLTDDCLMEIFSYLDFDEMLKISEVCRLFSDVCKEMFHKIKHFELDFRLLSANNRNLNLLFSNLGPHMISFKFSGGYIMDENLKRDIIVNVAKYCWSLKHLTLNYLKLPRELLLELGQIVESLELLDLGRTEVDDDVIGDILINASDLKMLCLPGNINLTGRFLEQTNVESLEQLDLSYCYDFDISFLDAFLNTARNLKHVDVTACKWLPRDRDIFTKDDRDVELGVTYPEIEYNKRA